MNDAVLPRATHYHRIPVRLLNGFLRGLNSLGIGRIKLDESLLLARATKETGLSDFGDMRFREPLRVLLRSLETESDLNPVGRFLNRANIMRLLKHRLYVEDLLQRHPEILERSIPDPVVIVGLARSGTTRLHRRAVRADRAAGGASSHRA